MSEPRSEPHPLPSTILSCILMFPCITSDSPFISCISICQPCSLSSLLWHHFQTLITTILFFMSLKYTPCLAYSLFLRRAPAEARVLQMGSTCLADGKHRHHYLYVPLCTLLALQFCEPRPITQAVVSSLATYWFDDRGCDPYANVSSWEARTCHFFLQAHRVSPVTCMQNTSNVGAVATYHAPTVAQALSPFYP